MTDDTKEPEPKTIDDKTSEVSQSLNNSSENAIQAKTAGKFKNFLWLPKTKKEMIVVSAIALLLVASVLAYLFVLKKDSAVKSSSSETTISSSASPVKVGNETAESLIINSKDDLKTAKALLGKTVTKPADAQTKLQAQKSN